MEKQLQAIHNFLLCSTPQAWLDHAVSNQTILLIDHAHCEKKAASTALSLMYRYVDYPDLLQKMSRLAREELRHFEQVLKIMQQRSISYCHLSPSRYADGLRKHLRNNEPDKLIDTLIIGAIIEARSCERFISLAPLLDDELASFYHSLFKSEARHYQQYLDFANLIANCEIEQRVLFFLETEKQLIETSDKVFRFHSGVPV